MNLRFGPLWRNADFMKFWAGESVSLLGTQVTLVALPLTAVITLRATSEQLGSLRALEYLPFVLFALPFGVWTDRGRRRPTMIAANAGRAVLIGLVPLVAVLGELRLTLLYAIVFCVGVLTTLFDVSAFSLLPVLVRDRAHLVEANSRVAVSTATAEVAGPGIAGFLVQLLTAPMALVLNSIGYAVSVLSLCLVRVDEPRPTTRVSDVRGLARMVGEGMNAVFGNRLVRVVVAQGTIYNFCWQFLQTVFVIYVIRDLGFSPALYGLVLAIGSIGGVIGAALAHALASRFRFGVVLTVTMVLGCVPSLVFAGVTGPRNAVAAVFTAAYFVLQGGAAIGSVMGVSLRQAVTPDHLLGRMTASTRLALSGVYPVGALVAGFLGATIGLRGALWVAGLGFTASLLPVLLSPIPRLRSLPAHPAPSASPAAVPAD